VKFVIRTRTMQMPQNTFDRIRFFAAGGIPLHITYARGVSHLSFVVHRQEMLAALAKTCNHQPLFVLGPIARPFFAMLRGNVQCCYQK
jgi:hypothetical protein